MLNFVALFLLTVNTSIASEFMPKGKVLPYDAYVFNKEEAEELIAKIEDLERKQKLYEDLEVNLRNQISVYDEIVVLKDSQIAEHKQFKEEMQDYIDGLERKSRFKKLENAGYFALGVGVSVISILLADQVNDFVRN